MKALHVIKVIVLLVYVAFLVMVCASPVQRLSAPSPVTDQPAVAASDSKESEKVDFASGSFSADAEELTLTVEADEVQLLDSFKQLKSLDLSGSTCYQEIVAWAKKHPNVAVKYTVTLPDDSVVDNAVDKLDLSALDAKQAEAAIPLLAWLPELKELTLGSVGSDKSFNGEQVAAIRELLPDARLNYTFTLMGQEIDPEVEELDLHELPHEEVPGAVALLGDLPNLKYINLGANGGNITWEDVNLFRDACPDVQLGYSFKFWSKEINFSDGRLDLRRVPMDDNGDSVFWLLPYMHNLTYLDMDNTGVSNDVMESICDQYPDLEVVWRVYFGTGYSVRTDVEKILASSPSHGGQLGNDDLTVLKYCTKVKYLDLGHNSVITDISFVRSMPDLEVFIIALNDIEDISPLEDCPKLEFLEVTNTRVADLTPLSGLTELRHLNIGNSNVSDISPLFGLTELQRLMIGSHNGAMIPADQVSQMKACAPNCVINTTDGTPSEGSWKYTGYTALSLQLFDETGWLQLELHPRYALLREQFGYDSVPACYSLSINDPLFY